MERYGGVLVHVCLPPLVAQIITGLKKHLRYETN